MASIINADDGVISGAAGIKLSADTSGDLNIQTNGVTAISVSASQVVSFPATTGFSIASATVTNLVATSLTVSSGSTLNGGVVINELGADADTRIEGDTDANLLFVDASTDRIGVGTDTPARKFHVNSSEAVSARFTRGGGSAANNSLEWFDGTNGWYAGVSGSNFWGVAYNSSGAIDSAAIRLDSSGILGLGVTPSAWGTQKALEFSYGALTAGTSLGTILASNAYYNGTNWIYRITSSAAYYLQESTGHKWYTAPSGTAGNNITFGDAKMTLTAAGDLYVGATSGARGSSATRSLFKMGSGQVYFELQAETTSTDTGLLFSDGSSGNYGLIGYLSTDIMQFYTASNERARITAAGDLLVGTTATGGSLTVVARSTTPFASFDSPSAGYAYMALRYNGTAYGYFGQASALISGASNTDLAIRSENALLFASNGENERARITAAGELLVGTTNTSGSAGVGVKLHPNGGVYAVSTTSISDTYNYYSETASAYRFYVTNGGTVFATNTSISAISDQRLKENIRDLDAGLDSIMALKPRKFDWKEGKGQDKKDVRGFIAQEFEQVFPDLIDTWKDPAPDGEEPYKSVRQDLIPVLVKAIQEQQAMIEDLKAKVAALEVK